MVNFYITLAAIGIILGFVALIIFGIYYERRRTKAMRFAANSLGLSFRSEFDEDLLSRFAELPLFSRGHARLARNIMEGRWGEISISIMDYKYSAGSEDSQSWNEQTIIVLQSGSLELPGFTLQPEFKTHSLLTKLGFQDIDFDSHPEFSRRYVLQGAQEDAVRMAFRKGILDFYGTHPGLATQGNGETLLFYRPKKRVSPKRVKLLIDEGFEVLALFRGSPSQAQKPAGL